MSMKKKDFVEIEYTGRLQETGQVFDTTDEKIAKESETYNPQAEYNPVIICIGENHILQGIDEFLEGKEPGEYKVDLTPEKAFGKKNAEYIRMIPISKFKEHKIQPVPGLNVNVDGAVGMVKTVSGGRCLVDFNHPLAGKDVSYDIKVIKVIENKKVQIQSLLKLLLGVKEPDVDVKDGKATITLPAKLPDPLPAELAKKIKELTGIEATFAEKNVKAAQPQESESPKQEKEKSE